jgi:hypothetical protein
MPRHRPRRVIVAALFALAVAAAPASAATPEQARTSLNAWRAEAGLPAATSTVSDWNTGCQHHNTYMSQNGITHQETVGAPGYTSDGAKAGNNSVLAQGSFASQTPKAIWGGGVFHRVPLFSPRLRHIGYAEGSGPGGTSFYCLWNQNLDSSDSPQAIDNSPAARTPTLKLYPSPANGEQNVPTTFPGGESPDPHGETGVQAADQLGWLISVSVNGPWANGYQGVVVNTSVSHATLAPASGGAAVPLGISQRGAPTSNYGQYIHEGFGLFPRQILQTGRTYRATVSGTVHTPDVGELPFTNYTWTFRTAGPNHDPGAPPVKCRVPQLKGKSLRSAKTALGRAHCKLGRVTKPRPRRGHRLGPLVVARQSPKAGSVRTKGTKVALRLGPKPHH